MSDHSCRSSRFAFGATASLASSPSGSDHDFCPASSTRSDQDLSNADEVVSALLLFDAFCFKTT